LGGSNAILRIGLSCAAIVLGASIVGSRLSTDGGLARIDSGVAVEADAGDDRGEQAALDTEEEAEEDVAEPGSAEARVSEAAEAEENEGGGADARAADGAETDEGGHASEDQISGETKEIAEEGASDDGDEAEAEAEEDTGFAIIRRNP
jgi:hypothetical protein